MDWEPYTGRKVVCVYDFARVALIDRMSVGHHRTVFPEKGRTYEVRKCYGATAADGAHRVFLLLAEIVNEPCAVSSSPTPAEPGFAKHCFRPLLERETDISALTEIERRVSGRLCERV